MPQNRSDSRSPRPLSASFLCQAVLPEAFANSSAAQWGLSPEPFAHALDRSIRKHFTNKAPSAAQLEDYVSRLHLPDLALACACADGLSPAWDSFVSTYRPYLRSAAAAILRCSASSPSACDLADSLFADLYGLAQPSCSLFRYFHGRSSLKTWLRAVLAQRHIDSIRAARRLTSLDDDNATNISSNAAAAITLNAPSTPPDPDRQLYLDLFRRTLEVALALLDPRDTQRLRLYYAEQQTLAEIGKTLAEHESSVSRNLERTRRELRHQVEQALRNGSANSNGAGQPGLSDAQIALCFEYASEESPIDFDKLFPAPAIAPPKPKVRP